MFIDLSEDEDERGVFSDESSGFLEPSRAREKVIFAKFTFSYPRVLTCGKGHSDSFLSPVFSYTPQVPPAPLRSAFSAVEMEDGSPIDARAFTPTRPSANDRLRSSGIFHANQIEEEDEYYLTDDGEEATRWFKVGT